MALASDNPALPGAACANRLRISGSSSRVTAYWLVRGDDRQIPPAQRDELSERALLGGQASTAASAAAAA